MFLILITTYVNYNHSIISFNYCNYYTLYIRFTVAEIQQDYTQLD